MVIAAAIARLVAACRNAIAQRRADRAAEADHYRAQRAMASHWSVQAREGRPLAEYAARPER